jgi:hypothetical protein
MIASRWFFIAFGGVIALIGLFLASVLLYSQAATTRALMPLGLELGISPGELIALFPAVNGYFLIPATGSLIAALIVAAEVVGSVAVVSSRVGASPCMLLQPLPSTKAAPTISAKRSAGARMSSPGKRRT